LHAHMLFGGDVCGDDERVADLFGQLGHVLAGALGNDLSHDLPPEVLSVLGPSRTFRAGAIVGSLLKRTGAVKDLWRLRKQAKRAAERLAVFLEGVIRQLG